MCIISWETITYPPQNAGTFENDDDFPNFPFGGIWTRVVVVVVDIEYVHNYISHK